MQREEQDREAKQRARKRHLANATPTDGVYVRKKEREIFSSAMSCTLPACSFTAASEPWNSMNSVGATLRFIPGVCFVGAKIEKFGPQQFQACSRHTCLGSSG